MGVGQTVPNGPAQVLITPAGPQTSQQLARQPQGRWADSAKTGTLFPGQSVHPISQAPSMARPSAVADQVGNPDIAGQLVAYDPSVGPTFTQVPTDFQARAMQAATMMTYGTQAYRKPVNMPHCKVSGRSKRHFLKGDIISLPYHSANMDRNLNPEDFRLAKTHVGWVYSKRRMMIVLWLHADDMFAIPLFTWQGADLAKKKHAIHEYVAIKNKGKELPKFDEQGYPMYYGQHKPVEVETGGGKDMLPTSSAHLSGGRNVSYCEDITVIGRATQAGHRELLKLYTALAEHASQERWRPR